VRRWCKAANVIARGIEDLDIINVDKDIQAFQVTFPNGARIVSLSSNPNAFAGKGGDILLDEVDLHQDSGTLIDMALPCIDWGGQLEIVSAYAADGSSETPFAVLVSEIKGGNNPANWSLHETTIEDAVRQGLVEKINEARAKRRPTPLPPMSRDEFLAQQRAKCRTEDAWLSQYMCVPCNAAGRKAISLADLNDAKQDYGIIRLHFEGDAQSGDRIDPCVQAALDRNIWRELADEFGDLRYAFGYDVARHIDLASIWIDKLEGASDTARQVGCITFHGCKYNSMEEFIAQGYRTVGLHGAGDSTGSGGQTCENLEDRFNNPSYPDRKVFEGVNFSSKKGELGGLMVEAFEKGLQLIPAEHREIAADLMCIEKALTVGKRMTYTERANRLLPDSHADIAWSCALAKYARQMALGDSSGPVFGEAIKRRGSGLDDDDAEYARRGMAGAYETAGGYGY
jgi:phage FluMu gp28-like protein